MGVLTSYRFGATTKLTVAGTSASSALDGAGTYRLISDTDCHIKIGNGSQTSTTNEAKLPSGLPEYIDLVDGDQIGYIQASAGGSLWATKVAARP